MIFIREINPLHLNCWANLSPKPTSSGTPKSALFNISLQGVKNRRANWIFKSHKTLYNWFNRWNLIYEKTKTIKKQVLQKVKKNGSKYQNNSKNT